MRKHNVHLNALPGTYIPTMSSGWLNSLRSRRNRRHFADAIFKCIFLNENAWISLKISLKFVPKVPINNIPSLVQIMAWHRSGDKPLPEPMMVSLLTHICVARPQWVYPSAAETRWFRESEASTIAADALTRCVLRTLAVTVLDSRTTNGPLSSTMNISTTCTILVWWNYRKCKYIFVSWHKLSTTMVKIHSISVGLYWVDDIPQSGL